MDDKLLKEDLYKIYDEIVSHSINLAMSILKTRDSKEIIIQNFKEKNKLKLYEFHIACMAKDFVGGVVKLQMGRFDYLKFKLKHRKLKDIKRLKGDEYDKGIFEKGLRDIIHFINDKYGKKYPMGIYAVIYDEYYLKRKED